MHMKAYSYSSHQYARPKPKQPPFPHLQRIISAVKCPDTPDWDNFPLSFALFHPVLMRDQPAYILLGRHIRASTSREKEWKPEESKGRFLARETTHTCRTRNLRLLRIRPSSLHRPRCQGKQFPRERLLSEQSTSLPVRSSFA